MNFNKKYTKKALLSSMVIFSGVGLGGVPCVSQGAIITFDDPTVNSGTTSYSPNGNSMVVSTTDPGGFNPFGPGSNMSYINEPGIEGTTLLNEDIRVTFPQNGANKSIRFGFALCTGIGNAYGVTFKVFDKNDTELASVFQLADFTTVMSNLTSNASITSIMSGSGNEWQLLPSRTSRDGGKGTSSFPEGRVVLTYSGEASYATFDFDSMGNDGCGRYIIDDFEWVPSLLATNVDLIATKNGTGVDLTLTTSAEPDTAALLILRGNKLSNGGTEIDVACHFASGDFFY
ncbi:MAG: hypothetical protein KAI83_15565, partial [Thiomargarita sp.]|nr:hypothetical protein [Thiomargarita sp.]